MPRLALIQAEIRAASDRLEALREDGRLNPSAWDDIQPAREVLRLRLAELRRQEVIILNGRLAGRIDPAPHRKHADVQEADVSTVVYLLLLVAIVGVSVAMLMAAAGVL